jgi:SNF2 family DNA or RNA helicase
VPNVRAPFAGWSQELAHASKLLTPIIYSGDRATREALQEAVDTADVVVTSYELLLRDVEFFEKFRWEALVVDEAHRLKNNQSVLHTTCCQLVAKRRVLLTGTPIQNNTQELFSLLSFVCPHLFTEDLLEPFVSTFGSAKAVAAASKHARGRPRADACASGGASGGGGNGGGGGGNGVGGSCTGGLHNIVFPFMLRRTKAEVASMLPLPPKHELTVAAPLSPLQHKIYKGLLSKDSSVLGGGRGALMNLLMELRKCANHP